MLNYRKHINDQVGDGVFMRDPTILPPSARKLLEQIGNEPISSIEIVRTPLSSFTRGFLNAISLGQFNKISKKSYDQIFHLSLWINGKYNLEKLNTIAFNTKNPKEAKSEVKAVSNIPSGLTFQTLIDKTKARMGDRFGPYDGITNNCQDFLTNIFQANGIGDQSDINFIKQDTKEIFQQLPEFSKVLGKAATNLGAIFDRLLQGNGQIGGMDNIYERDAEDEIYDLDERVEELNEEIRIGMQPREFNIFTGTWSVPLNPKQLKILRKKRDDLLEKIRKGDEKDDERKREEEDYDSDEGKERVILGEDFELPSRIRDLYDDEDDDGGAKETKREVKGGTIAHRAYLSSLSK